MAYSGTVGTTVYNTRKVIDRAFRRARVPHEEITGEYVDIALQDLFLLLQHLANLGAPLWCVERDIISAYQGQAAVTMPQGTVDIMNANFRLLQQVTGTVTAAATTYTVQFASATQVTTFGFQAASNQTLTLSFQTSPNGTTWTTALTVASASYVANQWYWFDLDGTIAQPYVRALETSVPSGTINWTQSYLGNTPSSIPMARMNQDDYTALPNRASSGKPLQFWFNRVVPQPIMFTWPVCDLTNSVGQYEIWRQRQIMDVGTLQQSLEIPDWWFDTVVWGLAFRIAQESPSCEEQQIANCEGRYKSALLEATSENRDSSPIFYAPAIGIYTQ